MTTSDYRKLRARWTREAEQDLRAMHNIDAETELARILAEEINAEWYAPPERIAFPQLITVGNQEEISITLTMTYPDPDYRRYRKIEHTKPNWKKEGF